VASIVLCYSRLCKIPRTNVLYIAEHIANDSRNLNRPLLVSPFLYKLQSEPKSIAHLDFSSTRESCLLESISRPEFRRTTIFPTSRTIIKFQTSRVLSSCFYRCRGVDQTGLCHLYLLKLARPANLDPLSEASPYTKIVVPFTACGAPRASLGFHSKRTPFQFLTESSPVPHRHLPHLTN